MKKYKIEAKRTLLEYVTFYTEAEDEDNAGDIVTDGEAMECPDSIECIDTERSSVEVVSDEEYADAMASQRGHQLRSVVNLVNGGPEIESIVSTTESAGSLRNLKQQAFGIAKFMYLQFDNPTAEQSKAGVHSVWKSTDIQPEHTTLYLELVKEQA